MDINEESVDELGTDKQSVSRDCDDHNVAQQQQDSNPISQNMVSPKKRWTSALRVVTAMARFRNMPRQPNNERRDGSIGNMNGAETGKNRTASSSFSGSSESVPNSGGRNDDEALQQESESNIDPVYLALKEATEKYGNKAVKNRRFSQNIGCGGTGDSTTTPSSCSRNLSQASLLDSGTFSVSGDYGGIGIGSNNASSTRLFVSGGSTSQLEGGQQNAFCLFSSAPNTASSRGDRIKLTEKMKSFSLDCAEPPSAADQHQQKHGIAGVYPNYRMKQLRSPRTHAESFDQCMKRSSSPSAATFFAGRLPRRLPTVPDQQQQHYRPNLTVQQSFENSIVIPSILHIVTHEYIGTDCALRPGERLVVVDNGDPDWKHGFKLNDRTESLLIFPSTCIAAYRTEEEQPMRLIQTCNLMDQKMRLYRDQVVFVQPNSLGEDGRVTVRNEHDKFVKCPLQFLTLA
ncbi:hypothetical protein niasHT_034042 [Heterodera trifolii]|uniref:STAC3-related SH3 domain-containing protein n=1 Tax=Heterodera trifolii TaxID=157864 RepID=A0ABD2IHH1_9BILA